MRKALLIIPALCAGCALLSLTATAQLQSSQPSQGRDASELSTNQTAKSWSTKHLSATGRMNETPVRASKLTGAQVNDSSGNRAGVIQDLIVNPKSGRIEFALISLDSTPANNPTGSAGSLVPVPWSLLKTSPSQYAASSEQADFTMNVDQKKLSGAPSFTSSDLTQSEWCQRVYSYYGVTPQPSMGAAESPGGEMKGGAARSPEAPPPPPPQ